MKHTPPPTSPPRRGHRPRLDPESPTVRMRLVATQAIFDTAERVRVLRGLDSVSSLLRTLVHEEAKRLKVGR